MKQSSLSSPLNPSHLDTLLVPNQYVFLSFGIVFLIYIISGLIKTVIFRLGTLIRILTLIFSSLILQGRLIKMLCLFFHIIISWFHPSLPWYSYHCSICSPQPIPNIMNVPNDGPPTRFSILSNIPHSWSLWWSSSDPYIIAYSPLPNISCSDSSH